MKVLKEAIRKWTTEEKEKENEAIENVLKNIEDLDTREGEEGLSMDEAERREALKVDLARNLNLEEISWRWKSREKWLKEGDKNTKYFHCLGSHKRMCNYIEEITIDEKQVRGNDCMRNEVKNYFYRLYKEDVERRPRLDGTGVTEDEIFEEHRGCNGDKAPSLDGFNTSFLQEFWHAIEREMVELFREIHESKTFVKSLNTTF